MRAFIRQKLHEGILKEGENFSNLLQDLNATIEPKTKKFYEYKLGPSRIIFKPSRNSNTIDLELIETPTEMRGAGHAKEILSGFLNVIDNYGYTVELVLSPRDKGTSFEKLGNFYQNFGFNFSQEGGFESDFEMIR